MARNQLHRDLATISRLLNDAAQCYLRLNDSPVERTTSRSMADEESETLSVSFGGTPALALLHRTSTTYLFEATQQLQALSTLLSQEIITGTLELLTRAIVERCARVSWLLDHDPRVTPRVRLARVALEVGISAQHVNRVTEQRFGKPDGLSIQSKTSLQQVREDIEMQFPDVVKGSADATPEGQGDIANWNLGDTTYPNLSELMEWAWHASSEHRKQARATYALLSAFSHPSIVASQKFHHSVDGNTVYAYPIEWISLNASNGVAAFDRALQSFTRYFDRGFDETVKHLADLHSSWPTSFHA